MSIFIKLTTYNPTNRQRENAKFFQVHSNTDRQLLATER